MTEMVKVDPAAALGETCFDGLLLEANIVDIIPVRFAFSAL